jgi:hypothetical protein
MDPFAYGGAAGGRPSCIEGFHFSMTTHPSPHSSQPPSGRRGARHLVLAVIVYCSVVSASVAAAAALVGADVPVDALMVAF